MFMRKNSPGTMSTGDAASILAALNKSQAIIQFKPDGTILTANDLFLKVMGYSLDQIQGKHHSMFAESGAQNTDAYRNFWNSLRQGNHQSALYRRYANGGREVWLQASYNPIVNSKGEVERVIKFATDVTEETLRVANYEGQVTAISKSQAVIEFEPDGTIITANKNFLNALGYDLSEIQGRHHSMFIKKGEADLPEYKRFWEALRKGEFQAAEYLRIGKGGREVWIQASYNPILDPNGQVFKVVKFATDRTERVVARREGERVGALVDQNLGKILQSVSVANEQAVAASDASEQTLEMVQAVASASEELDASAREISQSMTISRNEVDRAMSETAAADSATTQLSDAASAMTKIVELIQDIAGQINLLALNATIEAARAGDAGKGFAVVASEVKGLASQVARATDQISTEITSMQTISGTVVDGLLSIRTAVEAVEGSVTNVAGAVEEQSATTREIASNLQSAAQAVSNITSKLETISDSVGSARTLADEGVTLYRSLDKKKAA
ncbi:MAG: PAS domain-containing methyl-accepting chemotaxis protein [Alphaproteobacteria bacterium]|nr:PAS domain-containing methyl-accepting chemotaxis protein [Alphaproteobacteria bacterium]